MESSVPTAIAAAKAQSRFLSDTELLQSVFGYVKQSSARMEAAGTLSNQAQSLIDGAAQAAYQQFPHYAATPSSQEKCVRAIGDYLRLIQYCLVADSTGPMDESLMAGEDEIASTSTLSPSGAIVALNYIKAHHGLTDQAALAANTYIDYTIDALVGLKEDEEEAGLSSNGQAQVENSPAVRPLWERLAEIGAQVPESEWAALPRDLARNFEHYMYGAPKEE